jgi:hypothetical protein
MGNRFEDPRKLWIGWCIDRKHLEPRKLVDEMEGEKRWKCKES